MLSSEEVKHMTLAELKNSARKEKITEHQIYCMALSGGTQDTCKKRKSVEKFKPTKASKDAEEATTKGRLVRKEEEKDVMKPVCKEVDDVVRNIQDLKRHDVVYIEHNGKKFFYTVSKREHHKGASISLKDKKTYKQPYFIGNVKITEYPEDWFRIRQQGDEVRTFGKGNFLIHLHEKSKPIVLPTFKIGDIVYSYSVMCGYHFFEIVGESKRGRGFLVAKKFKRREEITRSEDGVKREFFKLPEYDEKEAKEYKFFVPNSKEQYQEDDAYNEQRYHWYRLKNYYDPNKEYVQDF